MIARVHHFKRKSDRETVADANVTSRRQFGVVLRDRFEPDLNLPKIHFIAVDQPGHGAGPRADDYMLINNYLDWLERVIIHVRQSNKPLVIMGRSASPPFVRELIARWQRRGCGDHEKISALCEA